MRIDFSGIRNIFSYITQPWSIVNALGENLYVGKKAKYVHKQIYEQNIEILVYVSRHFDYH